MKYVQYWRWYRPPVGRERTPKLSRRYMTEEQASREMPPGSYKSGFTEMRQLEDGPVPVHPATPGYSTPGGVYPWHELQQRLLKEKSDGEANAHRDAATEDADRAD